MLWFLLIVVLVNVFAPLYCRKPDEKFAETLKQTEFTSETPGGEWIRCIDDNEEALLWRLRMIGAAKKSIVLATFDRGQMKAEQIFLQHWITLLKRCGNQALN